MDVSTLIARAQAGLGKKTVYASPGVMPPFEAVTWPNGAQTDCTGFVDWCLRFSANRKVDHPLYQRVNGGWFETSGIYADGLASVGYFTKIPQARPGAMVVYPAYMGADKKHHEGHIGIVLEANGPGLAGISRVIHCSLGNYRTKKDAIQITDAVVWQKHTEQAAIILWLDGMTA